MILNCIRLAFVRFTPLWVRQSVDVNLFIVTLKVNMGGRVDAVSGGNSTITTNY